MWIDSQYLAGQTVDMLYAVESYPNLVEAGAVAD
jgi:hypothetical protein